MKIVDGLIGGLAGAISITIIHEIVRKIYPDAPRLDRLGEQGAVKLMEKTTGEKPAKKDMYGAALAGDLIANALYYGVAAANAKHPIRRGGILGVTAGIGAVGLPGKMGLDKEYTAGSFQKKIITVGLYTLGGIIAGAAVNFFRSDRPKIKR
jgi:hypothetical protein